VIDFVASRSEQTELSAMRVVGWLGLGASQYFDWKRRYGQANEHHAKVPRDHWLEAWAHEAIVDFARAHPRDGYRRLAFMMLDQDVVAVSPASVYRVLGKAGLLQPWTVAPSKKGTGFVQPLEPHQHWHTDISSLNICGTFYYLCRVLDGCSRANRQWEILESMTEPEVELVLQTAKEKYPGTTPRLISDNEPQFIARDFKPFVRLSGMDHVRTSPYYPQSNGKIERWHGSLKVEAVRPKTPLSLNDARRVVGRFVEEYNTTRLHSAIGYVTPHDRGPAYADLGGARPQTRRGPCATRRPARTGAVRNHARFIPGITGTPVHAEPGQQDDSRISPERVRPIEAGSGRCPGELLRASNNNDPIGDSRLPGSPREKPELNRGARLRLDGHEA
jgi:transposase InsO family protein